MSPDVKRIKVLNNSKTFSATRENRSAEIRFRRDLVIKIAAFRPVDPFVRSAGDEEMSRRRVVCRAERSDVKPLFLLALLFASWAELPSLSATQLGSPRSRHRWRKMCSIS